MQDNIFASYTFYGGHVWTVKPVYKLEMCLFTPEMDYKHTHDTIYTHF